ncbi:hypothetical protein [Dactylosporangium sp. NPDC005555]|uniref:hypothetical protein n=1 Tax=Dactylosporangium sp. NPDC005555 TaxID=3154889 RepID=UPI0033A732FA
MPARWSQRHHRVFRLPRDDVGVAAARARLDDLLKYGGDIVIDARYVKASPDDPAAALLEPTDDADGIRIVSGTAPLGPMPSYQLVLLTTAGIVRNRLDLHAAPPTLGRRGGRLTMQDPTGTSTITMRIDLPEFGGATSVELHMRGLAGRYPYAVRTAVALSTGAESSDRIQLRADNIPIGEPNGPQLGPFVELITEGRPHRRCPRRPRTATDPHRPSLSHPRRQRRTEESETSEGTTTSDAHPSPAATRSAHRTDVHVRNVSRLSTVDARYRRGAGIRVKVSILRRRDH